MPGHRVPFSDLAVIDQQFICLCCGYILRDAEQTVCGHLYCHTCLVEKRRHENPAVCTAPGCETSLEQMQCFPDEYVRREILNLNVTCFNKDSGCHWNGNLRIADEHEASCRHRPVPCKNGGCSRLIPLCNLQKHEEEECPHHQVQCEYCASQETQGGLQDHLTICPSVLVTCPNCGQGNIPRGQVKRHLDPLNGECPRKPCPFVTEGCSHDELMDQATLNKHLAEGLKVHFLLLLRFMEAKVLPSGEECGPPTMNSDIKQDLIAAEAKIASHEWALNTHYCQYTEFQKDVKHKFHILVQVVEQLGERVQKVEGKNAALVQEVAQLKTRVEAVKTQTELRDERVNGQLQFTRACCGSLSRSVQDLHRQNETYSYNGELLWIISDVQQKCAEARGNPDHCMQSRPFYTSRYGYKVCIRLYMNGHEGEWGSKMSFFFILMKGECDPLLSWPFPHPIEFRLMGQGASKGNDVVVHFQPHPRDESFARPVQGMNEARGAPHCAIPVENLRSEAYVDDNIIFVKVLVREK